MRSTKLVIGKLSNGVICSKHALPITLQALWHWREGIASRTDSVSLGPEKIFESQLILLIYAVQLQLEIRNDVIYYLRSNIQYCRIHFVSLSFMELPPI